MLQKDKKWLPISESCLFIIQPGSLSENKFSEGIFKEILFDVHMIGEITKRIQLMCLLHC